METKKPDPSTTAIERIREYKKLSTLDIDTLENQSVKNSIHSEGA